MPPPCLASSRGGGVEWRSRPGVPGMGEAELPKVLLATGSAAGGADVRQWLQPLGLDVVMAPLGTAPGQTAGCAAVVVDGRPSADAALDCCRRLRAQAGPDGPPIVYLAPTGG